jgi:hypothetical protein
LQRCGGDGTHVECLGSRGWVCLGAMRRDTLWFGSLGHERFRLARFGWAGLHWNVTVWIGKLGIEMVRQSGIGLVV